MPDFLFKMSKKEKSGLVTRARESRSSMTEVLHLALQTYLSGSVPCGINIGSGNIISGHIYMVRIE